MTDVVNQSRGIWRSVQLLVGFHKDKSGAARAAPKVWPPRNASASIHPDPSAQEAIVVVRTAKGSDAQDVQIKLRQDQIILRRNEAVGWQGIMASDHSVTVAVDDVTIRINPDGSITREQGADTTWVEADGSILKQTPDAEASMSADGVELIRRTSNNVSAIKEDGVVSKAR